MSRKIIPIKTQVHPPVSAPDPVVALREQAANGNYAYLLAYADDGILWGKVVDKKLVTSGDLDAFRDVSPQLRTETLWEARLFGPNAEYLLWREGQSFKARLVMDQAGKEVDCYDESLILWGTDADGEAKKGFFPVREADMGIRHTPPLLLKKRHSLRLVVRNYLKDDEAGAAVVTISRLVDLSNGE
jgi:CRISPR-associated protein (TIGR03984 family)